MSKDEIDTLFRAIKGIYTQMEITPEMLEEWTKWLQNYEFEDVENNFNNFVLAGNRSYIAITDLIKDLRTKEQKKPLEGLFKCKSCDRWYNTLEQASECYERDRSIRYIKKMSGKFGIDYTEYFGNIDKISAKELYKHYDEFMLRLCREQQKNPILTSYELIGLRGYYKNVLLPSGMKI